jgi:hypothetical protein
MKRFAGLVQWAASRASVHRFLVCVAASNLPLRRLAEKLGFVKTEEYFDDESDGTHLVYVLHGKALTRLEGQQGGDLAPSNAPKGKLVKVRFPKRERT